MKEFLNLTDLTVGPEWICQQLASFDTAALRLHLKRHRRKDQLFSGYCRYNDFQIVAAIHEIMPLPFLLQKPTGSTPNGRKRCGYDFVWHEMKVATEDQALVWVVGHEIWHYLCKTRQMRGNWETRANRFGFDWLARFAQETKLSLFSPARLVFPPAKRLRVVYG